MSKTAAAVLTFVCFMFAIPMSAQLIPHGNVFVGVGYGQLTYVTNQQSYKGWEGSFEAMPFIRFRHLGLVIDGSGFYRKGNVGNIVQYNGLAGVRYSGNYGKWRPFIQGMGGIQHIDAGGIIYNPPLWDIGGGADYKIPFKQFAWRFQGDYMRSYYASAQQNHYRASTGLVWRF